MSNARDKRNTGRMPVPRPGRERLLWLALAGVIALGVLAVTQIRLPEAPPGKEAVITAAAHPVPESAPRDADRPAARAGGRSAERPDSPRDDFPILNGAHPPVAARPAMDVGSGVEMPFDVLHERACAGYAGSPLPDDPAGLCGMLRDLLTGRARADVSAVRDRLLALGPEAIPALSALLHGVVEAVEIEAVRLLAQIGVTEGLALALGKILTVPAESAAYRRFLEAFDDNRNPAIADWLAATLGRTEDALMRRRLLDLLAVMRGPEVVEALERTALHPADALHARDSLDSLAMRRDPSETEALAALLGAENEAVHTAAAYGLASIGSGDACLILADAAETASPTAPFADALGAVSSAYAQETLLALALDAGRSAEVRVAAMRSLSGHSGYRIQTALANAAVQERDTAVAEVMQTVLTTASHNQAEAREHSPITERESGELCF